jgi:hypothetical protein
MPDECRNPLCKAKLGVNHSRGTQHQFCEDRCRLIHWILKKAAKLLAPLEQSRGWEILLKLSREG